MQNTARAALISVTDKTGLVDFARELKNLGFLLLSTSGSGKHLTESKVESLSIETYTAQREILDGRVKTLHPKIHAGILAKRSDPAHMQELSNNEILPIDLVVINLYPFIDKLGEGLPARKMVEFVDVGGPTMLRAAAKNFESVFVVCDPADYSEVLAALREPESVQAFDCRRRLAVKAFSLLARDNMEVARYFSETTVKASGLEHTQTELSGVAGAFFSESQELRYAENPHQQGRFYRFACDPQKMSWKQLSGKELSYNNILDCDAAIRLVRDFHKQAPFAFIIKHLNPCGAAFSDSLLSAFEAAKRSDPRSHFGGVIGFNGAVTAEIATAIREDFAEIVVAPSFEAEALELLKRNKNLRLITIALDMPALKHEMRAVEGGVLFQVRDAQIAPASDAKLVTDREPSEVEMADLELAWRICAHVKSNAIVLVKDKIIIGVGAGQMSRIDAVELAIAKAKRHGHTLEGAVCASDAFFPFSDNIEALAGSGIKAVIAPGGAKRDSEVIEVANKHGVSLLFAEQRHFRH